MDKKYKVELTQDEICQLIYLLNIQINELKEEYDRYRENNWWICDNTINELNYDKELVLKLKQVIEGGK